MTRRAPHRGPGPGHADGPKAAVPQPPPSARLPPPPLALVSRGTSPSRAPGHRWRRPPAVTTGDPAGQRSPSAPGPPCDGGSPKPAAAAEPFRRSRLLAGRKGSVTPRRARPPRARGGNPRETSHGTHAAAPAARAVPAGLGPRGPPRVPAVTLVPLSLPFPADVQLALVLGSPAPDPVHLVRRQGVLQALAAHPAGAADLLRPCYLPSPRPVRADREEQLRIRLQAGGGSPPVTPFLRQRGALSW
jgi:hypothetical protein